MEDHNKSIHIQLIGGTDEFSLLEKKWNTALSESTSNSIFLRWEWLYYWWKAFKEKNFELAIVIAYREDKIIGIAPFYIANVSCMGVIPVRRLLFLGTKEGDVMSEFMDIFCNPGDEDTAVRTIFEFIIRENICDDFSLHKMGSSSNTISLFIRLAEQNSMFFSIGEEYESPFVRLPSTMDDFLHGLSSSMRYKIRKNRRKLEQYSHVEFRKTAYGSEMERDFDELVRLHQVRWKTRHHPGSFADKSFLLFQKLAMTALLKNGCLDLWLLSVDGKNICAHYNMTQNGKVYAYQSGLDTSFDAGIAPGYLMHSYCIENAIQHGFSEYHFLLKGRLDGYKKRWAKNSLNICDIYMARPGIVKVLMMAKNKARDYYCSLHRHCSAFNS